LHHHTGKNRDFKIGSKVDHRSVEVTNQFKAYFTFTFNFQSSTAKTPTPTLTQFLTDTTTSAQKVIHNSSNNLAFLFIAGRHFSYGDFCRSVSAKLRW